MRIGAYILCVLFAGICLSCGENDMYAQRSKTLDSLNGSINSMVKEFEKIDTNLLSRAVIRYNYYKQFVHQNVNDTLTKEEADNLQRFLFAGENLEHFQNNRRKVLSRAQLINAQIGKLSDDIHNKRIETRQLITYSQHESVEVNKITDLGYAQQKLFFNSMEEYKNSLKGVELLIRSRNRGELPLIIKDTIEL